MDKDIEIVVKEVLSVYPDAVEVDVLFNRYEEWEGEGNEPFIDKFNIVLEDGDIETNIDIINKIDDKLDNIRLKGYGFRYTIDLIKGEIKE